MTRRRRRLSGTPMAGVIKVNRVQTWPIASFRSGAAIQSLLALQRTWSDLLLERGTRNTHHQRFLDLAQKVPTHGHAVSCETTGKQNPDESARI